VIRIFTLVLELIDKVFKIHNCLLEGYIYVFYLKELRETKLNEQLESLTRQ
jgi:hypothetical protein